MPLEYEIRFSRYDRKSGESRLSDVQFIHAEDFRGALTIASAILTGLKTDLDRDYRIISIDERGTRGIDCRGGGVSMFETAEEFSRRVLLAMSDVELNAERDRLENNSNRTDNEDRRLDIVLEEIRQRNS